MYILVKYDNDCFYITTGGLVLNVTRNEVMETVEEYHKLPELIETWSKTWLICVEEITIPREKYYKEFDAIVHVF